MYGSDSAGGMWCMEKQSRADRAATPKASTPKRVQGYHAQAQGLPLSRT